MIVLDTNVVSALMRHLPPVVARLKALGPGEVAVPQPVLAEIAYGLQRLPRSRRRDALEAEFALVCTQLARAEWTDEVSRAYGRIKATLEQRGERIEDCDAAIAAHALAVGATLASGNAAHMRRVPGLTVVSWTG